MSLTVPARVFLQASLVLACAAPGSGVKAQPAWPPISPEIVQAFERLLKHAPISQALDAIKASSTRMFEEQVKLTEIPAPPFKERARAEYYLKKVREAGLRDSYIDKEATALIPPKNVSAMAGANAAWHVTLAQTQQVVKPWHAR
jgi:hypothetical protein